MYIHWYGRIQSYVHTEILFKMFAWSGGEWSNLTSILLDGLKAPMYLCHWYVLRWRVNLCCCHICRRTSTINSWSSYWCYLFMQVVTCCYKRNDTQTTTSQMVLNIAVQPGKLTWFAQQNHPVLEVKSYSKPYLASPQFWNAVIIPHHFINHYL